ncbi:MAG: histidine kinase [Lachnospiraceae bacterium]|nr:histidine kinase [Lachnospiraceae bacterium]
MNRFVKMLNRISIKRKLYMMLVLCVFLPLLITDFLFVTIIIRTEMNEDRRIMNNVAESVKFTLSDYCDSAYVFLNSLASDRAIDQFVSSEYGSPLSFYEERYPLVSRTPFANDRFTATIYSNKKGIVSGGSFQDLSKYTDSSWYKEYMSVPGRYVLHIDYDKIYWREQRVISAVSVFDFFHKSAEKENKPLIKVDMNYSDIQQVIDNSNYSNNVYVCLGDRIIFSNDQKGGVTTPFLTLTEDIIENTAFKTEFTLMDKTLLIYIIGNENIMAKAISENANLFITLILFNLIIPITVYRLFVRSFVDRLRKLTDFIEGNDENSLGMVMDNDKGDEISKLTTAYNNMTGRINNLIDNEYKERLRRQDVDIARQRAELHALHSQINPHFLFNALESIRMHSLLKKENETARMVEKLAIIQRQNVDWNEDSILVKDEVRFVEAYLELQKYRFGNKLIYEISVDEECENKRLPKITLVTFVENACIHGMENKTSSCYIFVRICMEGPELVLEVEDTGTGMPDDECRKLLYDMENVSMSTIEDRKSIGILNAALRLKMFTGGRVKYEIESERGVGTIVTIRILQAAEDDGRDKDAAAAQMNDD